MVDGDEAFVLNFFIGDRIFVPGDSIDLKMYGQTQMLKVSC